MPQILRFCSWNIQVGLKRARVLDIVANHSDFRNLDLMAIQEASAHALGDDATQIALVLGEGYASYHHVYHHIKTLPQANALVWNADRIKMQGIEHHILPTHMEVLLPRAERAVLNRLKKQSRVNLVGDGSFGNVSLRVCAAHLDVLGYRFKRHQFQSILADLKARTPVDLSILAGDFNTIRIGGRPTWAQLKQDAADASMRAISDKIVWTQTTLRMRQKLDEIFVASVQPIQTRVWTLDVKGSDHLPIFAEIVIP